MRTCYICDTENADDALTCVKCHARLVDHAAHQSSTTPRPSSGAPPAAQWKLSPEGVVAPTRVSVVDINMPFASMVGFMIKWALAAIPALFILFGLSAVFYGLLIGIVAGLFGSR